MQFFGADEYETASRQDGGQEQADAERIVGLHVKYPRLLCWQIAK
jgi:hypothetical protein